MTPQNEYYSNVTHDFRVSYKTRSNPFNMTSFHYHNVNEIYFCISGKRKFFYTDKIYCVNAGDIVLIKKYEIHSMGDWDKPGHSRILIDFKDKFLSDFSSNNYNFLECFDKNIIVISPNSQHKDMMSELLNNLLYEYKNNFTGKETMIKIKLIEILITISRLQDIYGDKKEPLTPSQTIIENIMKYINENYEKNLTLQKIADYTGYSQNYLCSFFKKNSGFSIIEYLNGIRIKKSQQYLKTTNLSVTEISKLCGFESITHFGRVFKIICGCSPLQYRKKYYQ